MWELIEQIEKIGRLETSVLCKNVRFFPRFDGAGKIESFGKLGFLCLRVIVGHPKHGDLKLTLNTAKDPNSPGFSVTHPQTMGRPIITVGQGKTRRQIVDDLAPEMEVKGIKESYDCRSEFTERIAKIIGKSLTDQVMDAFARRFVMIMTKRDNLTAS